MTLNKPSNNNIALTCIISGVLLTAYIFAASRNDPGLRMAALVSATSISAALIAIASTMLVGTNVMAKNPPSTDPNDLPPGSVVTTSGAAETVQTPPIAAVPETTIPASQ